MNPSANRVSALGSLSSCLDFDRPCFCLRRCTRDPQTRSCSGVSVRRVWCLRCCGLVGAAAAGGPLELPPEGLVRKGLSGCVFPKGVQSQGLRRLNLQCVSVMQLFIRICVLGQRVNLFLAESSLALEKENPWLPALCVSVVCGALSCRRLCVVVTRVLSSPEDPSVRQGAGSFPGLASPGAARSVLGARARGGQTQATPL